MKTCIQKSKLLIKTGHSGDMMTETDRGTGPATQETRRKATLTGRAVGQDRSSRVCLFKKFYWSIWYSKGEDRSGFLHPAAPREAILMERALAVQTFHRRLLSGICENLPDHWVHTTVFVGFSFTVKMSWICHLPLNWRMSRILWLYLLSCSMKLVAFAFQHFLPLPCPL